jgi:glutamate--cysteine ligase
VSLDSPTPVDLDIPVGSTRELVDYLRAGEKKRSLWRLGTEHEKIGLNVDTYEPVPYDGPRGIRAVLESIAELDGWAPTHEHGLPIALGKGRASITIEPGGQIELSGAPLHTVHDTCDEFHTHLDLVKRVSAPLGLLWVGLGMQPLHGLAEVPRMPKDRYRIMRDYLPTRGKLALHMMHLTATVQTNVDFSDEADMVAKMRTAMAVTPIVSAIFANSSLAEGHPTGFVSRRMEIWRHTDPDRCGLLHFVFEPDFGYERYVEWALDVPLFFIVRDENYLPTPGLTFRQLLRDGWQGHSALLRDFHVHLTTLFPEVRLKQVMELRGADAVPAGLTCSLPAIWKGLLYEADALEAARALVSAWGVEEREQALAAVARRGLEARVGRRRILELARELASIAAEGLRRIRAPGASDPAETRYLDPVWEQLELGMSPGRLVLERWEGEWGRSLERLIEYARY